jgi:hypothetical protein
MQHKIDIKALQLESRFSMPPNSLGYCGRDTATDAFRKCIFTGQCNTVTEEITHFIVLYPYLKTISQVTGLPYTDYKVIESYWLGNSLLKQFKPEHYSLLIDNLEKQGVPDFLISEMRTNPPKRLIPLHLFNILHVGVGRASGSVEFNLDSVNHCMVRWGDVVEITKQDLTINLTSLTAFKPPFGLEKTPHTFKYEPALLPRLKIGSIVAVHWQQVVKVLTKQETFNLSAWTQQLLSSLS